MRAWSRSAFARLGVALGLVVLCLAWPLGAALGGAAVVLLLAPLGRTPTVRLGGVLLAWLSLSQFLYVPPWPSAFPPRQAVLWTLGALAALGWASVRKVRWPHLEWRRPDWPGVTLAAFVGIVTWWWWPWQGDASHALARLLLGWDHSGHYAMVEQLRAPDPAAASAFGGYPRGYHALVASLMELGAGRPGPMASEIVPYTYACLAVMGASLVMAAAFVLAAPGFRRRPLLLAPALGALVTLYLQIDDSAQVPYYGFGNFLEAAGFVAVAALLPLFWTHRVDRACAVAFGLVLAGVVGTWPLLLVMCAPVPVAVWLARRRSEPDALRRLVLGCVIAAVPLLVAFAAQPPATASLAPAKDAPGSPLAALDQFLLLGGAIRTSSTGQAILFPIIGLLAPLALLALGWRGRGVRPSSFRADERRAAGTWLIAAVLLGTACALLFYAQVRVGEFRYYGIKVLCAATIAGGSLAVAVGATLLGRLPRGPAMLVPARAAVAAAASALLVSCMGLPVPLGAMSPGAAVRADLATTGPDRRAPLAHAILDACAAIDGRPGEYYLLVPGENHEDLVRAGVWVISCGLNWGSPDHSPVLRQLLPDTRGNGADEIVDLGIDTARILTRRPDARVLVPKAFADVARSRLALGQWARLVTY